MPVLAAVANGVFSTGQSFRRHDDIHNPGVIARHILSRTVVASVSLENDEPAPSGNRLRYLPDEIRIPHVTVRIIATGVFPTTPKITGVVPCISAELDRAASSSPSSLRCSFC